MKPIAWQYYFARKFSLQRYEIVMRVFVSEFYKQHFGVRLKNILVKPEGGKNYAIYIERHELVNMQAKIFKMVCKNLSKFYFYKRMIKTTQTAWLKAATMVARLGNEKASPKRLLQLYDIFIKHYQEHFNKPIWIIFPIEQLLANAAEAALGAALKRADREDEADHWLEVVFSPEEANAISLAQLDILAAARAIKKKNLRAEKWRSRLRSLVNKHSFIPCYDVVDKPWEDDYFAGEIKKLISKPLLELNKEWKIKKEHFNVAKQNFTKFLKQVSLNKRERELCIMAHELVFLKDERDDYRRRGSFYGRIFFEVIGQRLSILGREVACLTIQETRAAIIKGLSKEQKNEVLNRSKKYLLLCKNGGRLVVVGGSQVNAILKTECPDVLVDSNEAFIKGTIGSKGKAMGKAVIVQTKHDLRRVFPGAIMVAVTTNPDFVPAMQKCAAIVTDEGGLTCHAAIVSREMHKPCLVGTKVGTRVFKEGEILEVDAEKGMVRKL